MGGGGSFRIWGGVFLEYFFLEYGGGSFRIWGGGVVLEE